MATPPRYDVSRLNSARRAAARIRGEWLMFINDGTFSPGDLMKEAALPESKALLKLSLRQVLLSQRGWGRKRTDAVIDHIAGVIGAKIDRRHLTVGWLLDPRAGGRRFAAWLDAFQPKTGPIWPGFPYVRSSDV
jgi:hypothetical protein